jgi:hypothetical protein
MHLSGFLLDEMETKTCATNLYDMISVGTVVTDYVESVVKNAHL